MKTVLVVRLVEHAPLERQLAQLAVQVPLRVRQVDIPRCPRTAVAPIRWLVSGRRLLVGVRPVRICIVVRVAVSLRIGGFVRTRVAARHLAAITHRSAQAQGSTISA